MPAARPSGDFFQPDVEIGPVRVSSHREVPSRAGIPPCRRAARILPTIRLPDRNRHAIHAHAARYRAVAESVESDLALLADEAAPEPDTVPDERLKLLFVCAHPAIDPRVRTPLMLQTVLGLDAAQIGAAFLVAPAAMGQRLVRAKAKIKDAGLRFEVPTADDMPERLADVLEAVYAAYGTSWDSTPGADGGAHPLAAEAIFLGRLLAALLPSEPEAKGLLALMLYCESRRAAPSCRWRSRTRACGRAT